MNVTQVTFYQDTAFYKHVGDKESSWHQDQQAAPITTDNFVTLWIPLEDLDANQGTLMFATGSHKSTRGKGGGNPEGFLGSKGIPLAERTDFGFFWCLFGCLYGCSCKKKGGGLFVLFADVNSNNSDVMHKRRVLGKVAVRCRG